MSPILLKLAQKHVKKYQPFVIGIVSSSLDQATVQAVRCVLENSFTLNQNGLGRNITDLLLNIINFSWPNKKKLRFFDFLKLKTGLWFKNKNYPQILVLDFSKLKYLEFNKLIKFLSINIAVINTGTASKQSELKKKLKLLSRLNRRSRAVINIDQPQAKTLLKTASAKVFSFTAKNKAADLKVLEFNGQEGKGFSFKIAYQGSIAPIKLSKNIKTNQLPAVLAGIAVGILKKVDLVKIAQRLEEGDYSLN